MPVMCYLDIAKPASTPVFQTVRKLRAIDKSQFRADVAAVFHNQLPAMVKQLEAHLRAVLDVHAPAIRRLQTQRRSSPWYSVIAEELRLLKQKRRQAEETWLDSGLTVHKQIMNSFKHQITVLVRDAKTTHYSSKVAASESCKELFRIANRLLGKTKLCVLPSIYPQNRLAQIFSDYFWGCGSWTHNAETERRLQAFEHKCYRKLLRIHYSEHKTNEYVRQRTDTLSGKQEPLLSVVNLHGLAM
ncbi:hypothetical protein ACOMHN_065959 [Nucella lapillus]